MDNQAEIKKRLKILKRIHIFIFICFLMLIVLLVFPTPITIYFAIAALFVGFLQASYRGKCPLTIEDRKMKEKLGIRASDDTFVVELLEEFLHVKASKISVNLVLFSLLIASFVYLAVYLYARYLMFAN